MVAPRGRRGQRRRRQAADYPEHVHEDTDEIFLVLAGCLHLDLPDRTVTLGEMDVFTVPRGVRHRPRATPGTRIVDIEPRPVARHALEHAVRVVTAARPAATPSHSWGG